MADPNFPIAEWDLLLFQAIITLNLLRSFRANPRLSAYAYVNRNFDFQATPLPPPGTKVAAHQSTSIRSSWAFNAEVG